MFNAHVKTYFVANNLFKQTAVLLMYEHLVRVKTTVCMIRTNARRYLVFKL